MKRGNGKAAYVLPDEDAEVIRLSEQLRRIKNERSQAIQERESVQAAAEKLESELFAAQIESELGGTPPEMGKLRSELTGKQRQLEKLDERLRVLEGARKALDPRLSEARRQAKERLREDVRRVLRDMAHVLDEKLAAAAQANLAFCKRVNETLHETGLGTDVHIFQPLLGATLPNGRGNDTMDTYERWRSLMESSGYLESE